MKEPSELKWIEGDLPDVHTADKNVWYLVWIRNIETHQVNSVEMVFPYENELNPLRWCSAHNMTPLDGILHDYDQGRAFKTREVAFHAKLS